MEPEVLDREDEERALELKRPAIPTSLAELAALKGEAVEIIEARIRVLETARMAGIKATHPEDWILFKARDDQGGQIVGYLQDSGCERVRDIFGISIYNVSPPEKLAGATPDVFHYLVRGDGSCTLTAQSIEGIEGGRSSTEDFCKDKTGAALELAVRKAARANLDGQIVRELAGLGGVPIAELQTAWTGTHKVIDRCRKGRGFGSGDERLGAAREGVPDVPPPMCPHCNEAGQYRAGKGNRAAFYGCKNWDRQGHPKWTQDAAAWIAKQQSAQPTEQPHSAAKQESPTQQGRTLTDQDIPFGDNPRGRR